MTTAKPSSASFMHAQMIQLPNQIELCVETGGDPKNPAMLLIMGLGAQLLFWPDSFCKKLIDAGFYVIRYDNRDIGLSSKTRHSGASKVNLVKLMARQALGLRTEDPKIPYHLEDMAEDAKLLTEALGLSQVHVVGGSMGGMIAQILAAKHPEKISSLSLLFTTNNKPLLPPPFPKQFKVLLAKPKSLKKEDVVNHSVRFMSVIGSPGTDPNLVRRMAEALYDRSFYPAGYMMHFIAITASGSQVRYDKQIKANTLVVHGLEDRLLHPNCGKSVAKHIKNARFVGIKGMGHDITPQFEGELADLFSSHASST